MKVHLTLLLATLAACSAHIGGRLPISKELDPHFYCGRKLAQMLATVCDYDVKRSGSGSMLYPMLDSYYKAQAEYGGPYVASQKHKNQESYKWPHKMDSQTDWALKSESQNIWPLKSGYYGLLSHKGKESEDWPGRKSQDAEYWPWLTPHKARGQRFVLSECCEKPCTVDELINYC